MTEDICWLSATELVHALRERELSAREVVTAQLDRIERVNPAVNAIVTLLPEYALEQAADADRRLAAGEPAGALHGIPMAHKDTHDTAGIRTTYGSPVRTDNVPDTDELIIERLRRAGVITLGKTNVPEFAAGSHTFNPLFGATRNPYRPDRSAGGSSGGAAVALACGLQPLADGSDMGGSLRNPTSFNNVVGLRPAPGRVPGFPGPAAWSTMAVSGPLARTVADVALMMSVIAGPDDRSPISISESGSAFTQPLERDLTGLRVAWSPDLGGSFPVDPVVRSTLAAQVRVFEELGCVVEEASPALTGADEVFRTLRAWQFELTLGPVLDQSRELLKPSLADNIEQGRRLHGTDLARAETLHTQLYHEMRRFFHRYDVLALPVSQVPPFDIELEYPTSVDGVPQYDYLDWMRSCYYITVTGSPALSVPAGFTPDGLPVGLQLVAPHRGEFGLLQIGHAFEQATRFGLRRPALPPHPVAP
ncbi:amidase [Amycolatopsis pithecellobii]|uniref:Amidase n=1 Tax=Amycolatopsis pithecellobii TaxID=664692 RepID=A0A6N7YSM4_9PSEU|nr:amidase [Amycolatopsis pithecellobii]MTD56037.1 amidase [Amycolatopsis pithecellobii]